MSDACQELITSIFQTLGADSELSGILGGTKIFDRVPERESLPYVVVGRTSSTDWSTATETGVAIVFFVHSWSQATDRAEIHAIENRIRTVLGADIHPMARHRLIHLRHQFSEIQRDQVRGNLHGLTRFRAVIEPKT